EPFFPYASATLYAEVSRTSGVYRAKVKLVDAQNIVRGARELEHRGTSCADIVDGMALSISIAIDPHSLVGPRHEKEETPPPPEPPPPEPPPPPVAEAPAPSPRTQTPASVAPQRRGVLEPIAGAALAGWVGSAPSATAGVLAYGGVRIGRLGMFLEARGDLPASREVAAGSLSTSFVGGSATPCWMTGWLLACGVATVGRIQASAAGIARPRDESGVHALAGLRGGVAIPVSARLDVRLLLDAHYALTPHAFRIDGIVVYELPRISGGLSAGTAFHFP
ncbi:MAG TPA: hypothetical protein VM925_07560, partial [Labilithrix sp.]|nr:hypothetical protein [Labilithrix sp.]